MVHHIAYGYNIYTNTNEEFVIYCFEVKKGFWLLYFTPKIMCKIKCFEIVFSYKVPHIFAKNCEVFFTESWCSVTWMSNCLEFSSIETLLHSRYVTDLLIFFFSFMFVACICETHIDGFLSLHFQYCYLAKQFSVIG